MDGSGDKLSKEPSPLTALDFFAHGIFECLDDGRDDFSDAVLHFLGRIGEGVGDVGCIDEGQVVHGIADSVEADVAVLVFHVLTKELDALALGAALGSYVDLDDILESIDGVTEFSIDLCGHAGGIIQALGVDGDLVDEALRAVIHSGDDVVFSGIVHFLEDADVALDVKGKAEIVGAVFFDDGIGDLGVDAFFADLFKLGVDDVGAAAGNVEVRLHKACDEGGQAADLAAGAQTEEVARSLVLTDLGYILSRELSVIFGKVEVQGSIKVARKYFFHIVWVSFQTLCGKRQGTGGEATVLEETGTEETGDGSPSPESGDREPSPSSPSPHRLLAVFFF